jgi:Flp pilus assembly pilin Flp
MKRFVREEEGLEFLEYAILAVVIAVAAAAAYGALGNAISSAVAGAESELLSD